MYVGERFLTRRGIATVAADAKPYENSLSFVQQLLIIYTCIRYSVHHEFAESTIAK